MTTAVQPEHGVKAVRDAVAALLVADLPGRIPRMEGYWSLQSGDIPAADMITSGETPDQALDSRSDAWIEVVTPRLLPRTKTVDLTPTGGSVNRYRYSARLYIWTLHTNWADALDRRDRLAVAVRDALFGYPTLAVPPVTGDTGFLVNTSTVSEEFGEPHRLGKGNPRTWAPALLTFEIDHEYNTDAVTTRDNWGVFNQVNVRVVLMSKKQPNTYAPGGDPHG